jgi:ABC-type nickel/cobalt efflux system permease component RcnA
VESTQEFIDELNQQLFKPITMANTATMGGLISCVILIILGILGIISVCVSTKRKQLVEKNSNHTENPFHTDDDSTTSSRASSPGRSSYSITSERTLKSQLSSGNETSSSLSRTTTKSLASIISVISRGTMTTQIDTKGTMTEEEEGGGGGPVTGMLKFVKGSHSHSIGDEQIKTFRQHDDNDEIMKKDAIN